MLIKMVTLREWRKQMNAAFKKMEEDTAAELRRVVPENMKIWLENSGEGVIKDLLEHGVASRKYRADSGEEHGFTDLKEFEQRFDGLRAAWSGVVGLSIDWDGTHRFEVEFTAL